MGIGVRTSLKSANFESSIFVKVVMTLIAVITLTACSQENRDFATVGIGSKLHTKEIDEVSTRQNNYFEYLCQQSGLSGQIGNFQSGNCLTGIGVTDISWTLIVHQGMNDIDRRCDAFLEWLDERRRSKGPVLAQIGTIRDTTNAILNITSPETRAIGIVAQAFGFITSSIEHYHDLLINLEGSTVNSVVLERRHTFRKETADFNYQTKPAAEFALRSYLRICLPFSIKSKVNDYSTLSAQGIDKPAEKSIDQPPSPKVLRGIQRVKSGNLIRDNDTTSLNTLGLQQGGIAKIISCGMEVLDGQPFTQQEKNVLINDAVNLIDRSERNLKNRREIISCLKKRGHL